VYPAEVKKVIDAKCYGCHSVKGKSQDAKDALIWDSLPGLQKGKIVATLDDIIKVLKENKMPPKQTIEKYPDMKLLPGEVKTLQSWAEVTADTMLK
jgi:cytochrome c